MAERAPGGLRRGLPRARDLRGDRPLPARLLRRGPRRRAVRAARRGRPAARRGRCAGARRRGPARRARPSRRARWCSRPPTRPTRSAPRCAGRAGPGEDAGHKPGRKAGALVVLVDGRLVLYVERGGRTLLTWADDPRLLQPAVDALSLAVREGQLGRLTVERADGAGVLDSPLGPGAGGGGLPCDPARAETAQVTAARRRRPPARRLGGPARRRRRRAGRPARPRQRGAEADEARLLLADFVRQARDRGIAPVALRARAINGRTLYKTGLTGWYLRRNGSLGVDEDGEFYILYRPDQPDGPAPRHHRRTERPAARGRRRRPGRRVDAAARPAAAAAGGRVGLGSTGDPDQLGRQHHLRRRPRCTGPSTLDELQSAGRRQRPGARPGQRALVLPGRGHHRRPRLGGRAAAAGRRRRRTARTATVAAGLRYGEVARRPAGAGPGAAQPRLAAAHLRSPARSPPAPTAPATPTAAWRPPWSASTWSPPTASLRDAGPGRRPAVPRRRRGARCPRRRHRRHPGGRADLRRARRPSTRTCLSAAVWRPTSTRSSPPATSVSLFTDLGGRRGRRPGRGSSAAPTGRRADLGDRLAGRAAGDRHRCTRCRACPRPAAPSSSACPARGTSGCRTSGSTTRRAAATELQTEYLLPREHARRRAGRRAGDARPGSRRCCRCPSCAPSPPTTCGSARRTAATRWRSTSPGSTTRPRWRRWSPSSSSGWRRSGARPHWGKVFAAPPATVAAALPAAGRLPRRCAATLDPDGVFGNAMVDRYLG